jgi:ABC-type proline/glycine betaine transport system substrate-binding protein
VATVEVAEDVGLNVTVTPVSAPAVKATVPVNGLMSVTVMVSVPLAPGATDKVVAEGLSVKPPVLVTVSVMEVVAVGTVPEVPVMVIG